MFDALNITEEEAQGLGEIAQHDLALARDFARRAQAAEDSEEANQLARSYQRAARSYRQTLALKVRLQRELAMATQARAQMPRPKPGDAAVAKRIGDLRAALLRLTWTEAERSEDEPAETDGPIHDVGYFAFMRPDVEGAISEACLTDEFCDEPLDDQVARLGLRLGYDPDLIARWRDLPDPPDEAMAAEPDDLDWRGSG